MMKLSNINNVTGRSDSSGDFKKFLKNLKKKKVLNSQLTL